MVRCRRRGTSLSLLRGFAQIGRWSTVGQSCSPDAYFAEPSEWKLAPVRLQVRSCWPALEQIESLLDFWFESTPRAIFDHQSRIVRHHRYDKALETQQEVIDPSCLLNVKFSGVTAFARFTTFQLYQGWPFAAVMRTSGVPSAQATAMALRSRSPKLSGSVPSARIGFAIWNVLNIIDQFVFSKS